MVGRSNKIISKDISSCVLRCFCKTIQSAKKVDCTECHLNKL